MEIKTIKTRVLQPPQDDLLAVISDSIKKIPERSILAITSKVVGIWEGRCIPIDSVSNKDDLIKQEADKYIPREFVPGAWIMHTIKNNLFIPSAGIDASNANNHYILWPSDPMESCKKICTWLKKTYRIKNLGVIITDSHTTAFRRGTIGLSLAHYGFKPLRNYIGKKDLFGRKMQMSQLNIADGLAAASVVEMGENRERTPLALITDIPWVEFTDRKFAPRKKYTSFEITSREDVYYPLIKNAPWRKGGGGYMLKTRSNKTRKK